MDLRLMGLRSSVTQSSQDQVTASFFYPLHLTKALVNKALR